MPEAGLATHEREKRGCYSLSMHKAPIDPEYADEKFVTRNFGLTHTPLFNLRKAGKIRSLSLRGEGQKYGKRLFHIGSIREFLAAQESRELEGAK
jgi:hypothetical protein